MGIQYNHDAPSILELKGKVVLDGVEFKSYADIANSYGISECTIRQKEAQGYPLEEVVKSTKTRSKQVEVNGIKYNSLLELAEAYGIKANTLRERLRRGIPIDKAVAGKGCLRSVEYGGKTYVSLSDLSESLNISYLNLLRRINNGLSVDVSVKECLEISRGERKKIEFRGEWYPSYSALAKAWGISKQILSLRLKKGWTLEEAVTTPTSGGNVE